MASPMHVIIRQLPVSGLGLSKKRSSIPRARRLAHWPASLMPRNAALHDCSRCGPGWRESVANAALFVRASKCSQGLEVAVESGSKRLHLVAELIRTDAVGD